MAKIPRRDLSAFRLFWAAMKEIKGIPGVLISLTLTVVCRAFVDIKVPLWIVAAFGLVMLLIMVALGDALLTAVSMAKSPRNLEVIQCMRACAPYDAYALFVVRSPDGLPANASLAFHVKTGELEQPLGYGTVQHDQGNNTYHVTLDRLFGEPDLAALFDLNRTKLADFSVRLEISLSTAARSRAAPVTKDTTRELTDPVSNRLVSNTLDDTEGR